MKILEINKFYYPKGGAETHLLSLIELLETNGNDVVVFSQKNQKNITSNRPAYFISDVNLEKFNTNAVIKIERMFWSFAAAKKMREVIAREKPDIAHVHNIYHQISPSILHELKKARIPVVMTVHDFKLITPGYTLWADGKKRKHKNSWLATALIWAEFYFHALCGNYKKNIDAFIAPSEFVKNKLVAAGFNPNTIFVQPHFITPHVIAPVITETPYILSFGRLDESKGIDTLITAMSEVKNPITLKIAGSGPEEAILKKLAASLPSVHIEFIGPQSQDQLAILIAGAVCTIFPSRVHETLGMGILESYNFSKPVIATRTGAFTELIKDDQTGILVTPNNAQELAQAIDRMTTDNNQRNAMARAGAATLVNHNPQKYYQNLMNIFSIIIQKSRKKISPIISLVAAISFAVIAIPALAHAYTLPDTNYPRKVNLFWKTPLTMQEADKLAKWDMVALDMQAQSGSAEAIKYLRQLNPKIIILAYTSSNELPMARINQVEPNGVGLWHDLREGAKDEWQLKTHTGENISWWPGNISMNLNTVDANGKTYADYLADFYQNKVLSTGLWDGLLFDNIWQNASWVNKNIDIDGDGVADSENKINQQWQQSYNTFFKKLRDRFGDKYIILGNGDGTYFTYENGRMMEGFPEYWEGGWTGSMKRYRDSNNSGKAPRVNIVNSDTENTGNYQNYQAMRYGLTSTLLYDGYFSFDYGTQLREQFWWYDEYDAKLGRPKSSPINLLNRQATDFCPGVWQREFTNGVVIVNSSDTKRKIDFDGEYEKLHGTQDTAVNSGARVTSVEINSGDGIILVRPINEIYNGAFVNGSFARIFDSQGKTIRTGFFAYDQNFRGQSKLIKLTAAEDNIQLISADNGTISLYNSVNQKIRSFSPFGTLYKNAISLAFADINGDGSKEIITGSEVGGANTVKIFSTNGQLIRQWNAYNKKATGLGVNVAAGDVNGDGKIEIITGAGNGGGPHMKIFDSNGTLISEFFAYATNFRGGVNVTTGDVNGDGTSEIITGPGKGGGPHLKIFTGTGKLLNEWFPYSSSKRDGLRVATSDIDKDGTSEVFAFTANAFTNSFNNSNTLTYAATK